jgi:hypothetical protein
MRLKEVSPNLCHVSENMMIDIADAVYAVYQTTFETFPTLQLKQQLAVIRIVIPFGRIFMLRRHCATMIPKQLPSRLPQLFMRFLGDIPEWMKQELNSEVVKNIIDASIELIMQDSKIKKLRRVRMIRWLNDSWMMVESRSTAISFCAMKQFVISTLFGFEQNQIMENFIRDVIFPCLYHDFWQICEAAIRFISRAGIAQ